MDWFDLILAGLIVSLLVFLKFKFDNLPEFPEIKMPDFPTLLSDSFESFLAMIQIQIDTAIEAIRFPEVDFSTAFESEQTQQALAGIVMGAIVGLMSEDENQEYFANFFKLHVATVLQNSPLPVPGLPPQTEEEQEATQELTQTLTSEVAMGMIEQELPPFVAGILDKKTEGWRDLLGNDPHAMVQVAGFLNQLGLRQATEGAVQSIIGGLGNKGNTMTGNSRQRGSSGVK